MKYEIDGVFYPVEIIRKNNKNTYLRIKEDLSIQVSTNYFITKRRIYQILNQNQQFLIKALDLKKNQKEKNNLFYYLGKPYHIIQMPTKEVEIIDHTIYIESELQLQKWYQKQMKQIYLKHYQQWYQTFTEQIPLYSLRMRKMKTRWGVCNRKSKTITLNTELLRYSLDKLDYVIIHELSHLLYFNHSNSFWMVVEKYCPNYKKIRKELKE